MKYGSWLMLFFVLAVSACDKVEQMPFYERVESVPPGPFTCIKEGVAVVTTITCQDDGRYRVKVIDGCEYLELRSARAYSLTHKGDCHNSIHQHATDHKEKR